MIYKKLLELEVEQLESFVIDAIRILRTSHDYLAYIHASCADKSRYSSSEWKMLNNEKKKISKIYKSLNEILDNLVNIKSINKE